MPLFSDLSSLGHYYSGSTSLNYLSGPYAGHSSIVAANYRTPTSTYSKPSSRAFANRGYTPLLATISENQITRAGLSRMNSPKMMYHASPKYKIQKPISINTADIDVSSNRYRRNLERTPLPISKPSQSAPKSPERSSSFKDNKENKESSPKKDEDSDGMFMPRIDKNFRSTIKRERTVVRFHTNRNLDKSATDETPKTEEEKRRETVRVFDEEVKLHKQKWRENFDPDELSPAKKRPQPQKPLSERLVEKFIIKEKLDEDVLNYEERRKQREENLLNYDGKCNIQRNSSRRKSVKKVPSFHDICRTISSESIDEDLNPGQPITRRNTRKKSSYDVLKAIRRDSAEINQEEILLLDALIKEAHLDKEYEITKQDEPKTEEPDKVEESDTKRKKKFTKKKSNELLVDDTKEETKCSPQRRKIVKKKTSGSLDKAIEVITPKEIKIDNSVQCEEAVASPTRKTMPKITGTVEVEMKPILKLVIDDIQVEETIMTSSSSPTSKKFKYNVTIEEIKSPNILDIPEIDLLSKLNNKTKSKIEDNKTEITKLKDVNQKKLENKIQLTTEPSGISKVEEDNIKYKKEMIIVNDKLDKELQNLTSLNKAELEKQKMLDIILGITKTSDQKIEDEKAEILGKKEETKQAEYDQKAEAEKSKMLDKLLGKKEVAITKNAEVGKPKILDKLTNKQEEPKLIDSLLRADEEKEKIINKLLGKNELTDSVRKAEEEKAKIIDKLLGKKEDSIINVEKAKMDKKEEQKQIDSAKKAEEEKAKMLDKLIGKKEEPKLTVSVKKTEEDKPKILNKSPSKKEESNLTDAALKAKEDKAKSDKKAEEEKNKMLDRLLGKKEDPKITGLAKKAEEIKALSDKKAEEEKAKMLDILLGKKEEPKITDIAKKAEEVKALSDKKAEEEKAKMLDRLLGKKEEPKITDIAKKAEEVKALSDKKAEEEKAKMLDRLLGKKEELKITDLTKKSEEVKALSDKKAEEEKAKMLDRLLGKTAQTKITVAKIAEEEKAKLDKKAEEEKEKMISKLMSKKEEPKLVDSVRKAEEEKIKSDKKAEDEKAKMLDKLLGKTQEDKKASLEIDSDKKAEEEKNKMLDKLLGKKPADLLQDTDKNKIKEELNKNVQKDQPKSLAKKLDITSKQLNEAKKSNLLSKVAPITNNVEKIDRRKTVQKQENLDELDIDNFWDKMGKRETIYYKDRRKYLNDRREQELKKICWDADWVEEEGEEESESPKIEPKGVQSERNISTELQEFPKPKTDTLKQEISKIEDPQITKLGAVSKIEEKVKPKEISKKLDNTQKPKLLSPKSTIKDASKLDLKSNIESKKEAQKEITLEAKATKIAPVVVLEEKIKPEVPKPIIQNASKQLDTKVEIEEKSSGKQEDSKIVTKEPIKPKLDSKPTEVSLDLNETLKTSKDIQKLGTKVKEEILDVKEASILNQKLKLGVKSKESLETKEQETTKVSKEEIKDACVPKKKLSNKQKSDENNKNIRPKVKRKSKEEPLKKQLVHYTQVQLEEMKGEIVEVKFEPITPHLSFIIKDKFDPVLKPNKDIIIPTAEEFANQEENKDDENRLGDKKTIAPMQSNYLAPDPKPKPKPKWFDTCPVVIMATPRDLRNRGHRMQKPAPKVTYVSDSSSAESDSSDEETSSSDTSGGSDVFETNVVFDYNKNAGNKWKSTSSNDSGFDSSAPGSPANNRNRIDGSTNASTSSSDSPSVLAPANNPAFILEPMEASTAYTAYQRSGRVTPPATSIPRFRKYAVEDFCFLKVLGKGSFGKVMLAELRNTEYYYAVKCLKKDIVLEDDDVECTLIERKVLALGTKHPYLCHLFCTFQTESHLFFVMEYLNGGDLMFHIQMSGRFPEPRARFYGAEIVSGLKFLHSKGIVYRDLKLDNILLDFDGHVRIADFGMCKLQIFLDRTADTFCGTPDYMAPEIIKGQHYNQGVDWWSFGVLLYEMLIGQSPFSGCDEDELFWSICNERPVIPAFLSREASQILTLLLEKDSAKRLGNKYCPAGDISDQSFFSQIDWGSLERRQLEAPFKPKVQHPLDTQYFDKAFTTEKAKLTPIEKDILHSMDQTQFHGFSYTNPNATDK